MNVLWVFAHPEGRSLNGSLRDDGIAALRAAGHEVRESDLYAMGFDPVVDRGDFPEQDGDRLLVGKAQQEGQARGTLSGDIRAEQEKVEWADAVVLHFPLWWFSMPAILKGWFDRVFVQGFGFGIKDERTGRVLRYGDNRLSGKRAMVVTSFGAREASMGPRGIHGDIDDLLFPIHHGILWYAGISAVPPLLIAGADRMDESGYELAAKRLRERLDGLPEETPIRYRYQDRGDYDDTLVLKSHLAPGRSGMRIHSR